MKDLKKILIVSYTCDNFGDNLIRICFEQLFKVVLNNLGVDLTQTEINKMQLRNVDEALVAESDIIAFAGGGIFGLSYLNFLEPINRVLAIAEQHEIPLFFSSLGLNNMDATAENEHLLKDIFRYKCIKAVSVRENVEVFRHYAGKCDFELCQVCDPAVWTKYIYHDEWEAATKEPSPKKTVGINVVRGGLFQDNGHLWKLGGEMQYLNDLKQELDNRGIDYVFYTNGSFLDDNSLHYYAHQFEIPDHQQIYPNTTRELVRTVAQFDSIAAIRMHSSIVAYALGIPSVNLIWNDKIPCFYENIGYADRAIDLAHWNGSNVFACLHAIKDENDTPDEEYMMSLYRYLYRVMSELTGADAGESEMFDVEAVKSALQSMTVSHSEDIADYTMKLSKSEKHYLSRYKEVRRQEDEIKQIRKETSKNITKKDREIAKLQKSLDKVNRLPSVRLVKAVYRVLKKLRRKS